MTQQPDSKPGDYYVSVVNDKGDARLLAGPYPNDHAAALADVNTAKRIAMDVDRMAVWYAYGTVRVERGAAGPGILNRRGLMEARA